MIIIELFKSCTKLAVLDKTVINFFLTPVITNETEFLIVAKAGKYLAFAY